MKFVRITCCFGLSLAASSCFRAIQSCSLCESATRSRGGRTGGAGILINHPRRRICPGSKVNWNGTPLATTFIVLVSCRQWFRPGMCPHRHRERDGRQSQSRWRKLKFRSFHHNQPTSNLVFSALPVAGTTSPISAVTADFNHDGIADLAVIDQAPAPSCDYQYDGVGSIAILLGKGDGTFTKHSTLCFVDSSGRNTSEASCDR